MKEPYFILIYAKDWADEFDCEGFAIMINTDWFALQRQVKEYFENEGSMLELGFGTNEELHVTCYEDWRNNIKAKEVDEDTARLLVGLFHHDDDIEEFFNLPHPDDLEEGEPNRRKWFDHGTGSYAMFGQIDELTNPDYDQGDYC